MDNLEKDKHLSLEETEHLCHLYMDCQLTLLEETELQYVLGQLPYSTPVIEEVRTLMRVSLYCGLENKERLIIKPNTQKKLIRKVLFAAASVAILLSIGIPTYRHFRQESELYCQVFYYGEEVSHDKAFAIAESELERIDKFFENMERIEEEQQQKIKSLE